ncbi:MAG: glycine cleavage system aminomethyltransferase GcvT [Thermoplasmata archaeon]
MSPKAPAPAPSPFPAPAPAPLTRTALFDFHQRHGAHLVPFAGWEMPLYYASIMDEHRGVRSAVGLFDVSHMGILTIDGGHAAELLSRRTTANVERLEPGQVRYTFLLEGTGGIVDDLLISRIDTGSELTRRFVVVPNAARAAEVEEIFRQHRRPDTTIRRWNGEVSLLAVQGPGSRALLEKRFAWQLGSLAFYHAAFFPSAPGGPDPAGRLGAIFPADLKNTIFVSRTGYTGELGYELFIPSPAVDGIAESLVSLGARPTGLAARDTLRLEKGYLLSGQEFHRDRTPLEAGQDRFVEFDHPFVGRDALEKERKDGLPVRLAGIEVRAEGAIPRHGTPVLSNGQRVAETTSGGLSPGLGRGIALAYLPPALTAPGTPLTLDIRGRQVAGEVVKLPFVRTAPGRP